MNYGIPSNISKAVVKGLQKSMQRIFGNGLETFVPQSVLKHGEALDGVALVPPSVDERPLLTAAT